MSPVSLQSATPPREVKSDASIDLEKMPVDQALAQLAVKPDRGLSSAEAPQRLNKYGPNALIEKEVSLARKIVGLFTGPIAYMIEACPTSRDFVPGAWIVSASRRPKSLHGLGENILRKTKAPRCRVDRL